MRMIPFIAGSEMIMIWMVTKIFSDDVVNYDKYNNLMHPVFKGVNSFLFFPKACQLVLYGGSL